MKANILKKLEILHIYQAKDFNYDFRINKTIQKMLLLNYSQSATRIISSLGRIFLQKLDIFKLSSNQ